MMPTLTATPSLISEDTTLVYADVSSLLRVRGCTGKFPARRSVPRLQPKLGEWATPNVAFSPHLFFSASLNAIFIKINPCSKIFVMNIRRAHVVGDTVAWGYHLHVPLRPQNCELSTPSGEKMPTEHQKHNNQHNNDVISAFFSRSHLICNK